MEGATVGGFPVECLTGQSAVIWTGWKSLGDREVVRESSVKGTHISLAQKCIAHRRQLTLEEAQIYFNKEVYIWVEELLQKRQIHKVSHILRNMEKEPNEYILSVCVQTKDSSLRNYLTEQILKNKGFNESQLTAWKLINFIHSYERKNQCESSLSTNVSMEEIINLPKNITDALYAELYFDLLLPELVKHLKSNAVWDFLLSNNEIKLIRSWIDVNYGTICDRKSLTDSMRQIFQNLPITEEMLESVEESKACSAIKQFVIDYFSRYGVFIKKERNDVKCVLRRFFSNLMIYDDFIKALSLPSCNISKDEFLLKVNNIIFTRDNYQESIDTELGMKNVNLLHAITKMCDENLLEYGVLEGCKYLHGDINEFLQQNCFIALLLIVRYYLNQDDNTGTKQTFKEICYNENGINIQGTELNYETIQNTIQTFPLLQQSLEDSTNENDITAYELLDGYSRLDVKELFKWRSKNLPILHFSNENLVKKYGHKEKLTYVHYLNESRPNMAVNCLIRSQNKSLDHLSTKMKSQASIHAHVFALRNLSNPERVCGAISFLEILGVGSENLRLHVTAANYVQKSLGISIGNLLELTIHQNSKALPTVLMYLEKSFESFLNTNTLNDTKEFLKSLQTWDIIVRFARAHHATLPTSLLQYLASKNSWFKYILVAHMFSYPINQVLENARYFKNSSIQEHISIALKNSQLLQDPVAISTSNYKDHTSGDDIWLTILECHRSQDPPGALVNASRTYMMPIYTVLATCYEPSSAFSYCCSWMVISVNDDSFLNEYSDYLEHQIWSAEKVLQLLKSLVSSGYINTLSKGFHIFMPDNPLSTFFDFLVESITLGDYKGSQRYLVDFKTRCSSFKCNKIINWECSDATYLENAYWITIVAVNCIVSSLGHRFLSTHLQMKFLDVLVKSNLQQDLQVESINFAKLLEYVKIVSQYNIQFNFINHQPDEFDFKIEVERCIHDLMKVENYAIALKLSEAADIDPAEIIIEQYRSEFKRIVQKADGKIDSVFWKRCAKDFQNYNVPVERSAAFFIEHAEKVSSYRERYEILKLALEILKENNTCQAVLDTIEYAMWKCYISAGPENIALEYENVLYNKLKTELVPIVTNTEMFHLSDDIASKNAVELLINYMLDKGQLNVALRISTIFSYNHRDLEALMISLSLAEGEISPKYLTPKQKNFLLQTNKTKQQKYSVLRNKVLPKLPSSSSPNSSLTNVTSFGEVETSDSSALQEQTNCLILLDKVLETLVHGQAIATRIALCYKLAISLGRTYQSLLKLTNPIQLLHEVIEKDYDYKLEIVADIITAYRLSNSEIAEFLSEEIHHCISQVFENNIDDTIEMWGYPLNANFHIIMELCSDVSLLGQKLLEKAQSLMGHSYGEKRSTSALNIIIEILIKSHDCFTTCCNMEGIASVLRRCQHLANSLQNLKHWALLVRLVTGVGRFTEMNYIFQILKDHHQFEFLLGKGLDKVPGLKTALLEFLKRNCPENRDLFNIVALHFRLYHEIAGMWESEGKDVIHSLIQESKKDLNKMQPVQSVLKITRSDVTDARLKLAMTNYTHATQYYLQDNKLHLAGRCSHQAELIALQISLLNSVAQDQQVVCILDLRSDEIDRILCYEKDLNFSKASILVRAYNHYGDWSAAIYHHFIVKGESKYLRDFMTCKKVTGELVRDCARRYQLEKSITKSMEGNMQILVSHLSDIECKYALASQLGFKNITEAMLNDPMVGCYLKDTVCRKGYSATDSSGEAFCG